MSSNHDPNQLSAALSNIALSYETQIFKEEYVYAKGLLDDAQCFEKAEMTRLREIVHVLTTENSLLAPSDQQDTESITTAVARILSESPVRSLSSPCASFYDELAPRLANFIEDNEEQFRTDAKFEMIWKGFRHAQATENYMCRLTKMIQELATKNYNLSTIWIRRAIGPERERLEAINGGPAHPDAFVRSVPFEVRSDQVAQHGPFAGLRELEKLCGGRDLVLRKTMPVEGIEGAVYHPLSPVYVPSFLGQGIPITSVAIELADDSVPCNHNTHDAKTAPGGSRLWVAKDYGGIQYGSQHHDESDTESCARGALGERVEKGQTFQ
ncbi:uncharacterized protein BKA78DRAFT_319763 [Phyllosticta capitalensis]|uniref:uncharacterized protein n=1 Tax=Phyllosticta capitalensis TaxID=121624 RepID=UPI00312FE4E1